MSAERWAKVREVFAAALARPASTRSTFVREACEHDADVAREVESLLTAHHHSGPIDRLAEEVIQPLTGRAEQAGMAGRTVAQYEIIEELSGGGMGVVYRARDTRLDRPVALKFLLPGLTRDPIAERRFVTEAKAAAALEHPNVCTIHEIGQGTDQQLFIVMPLYEGESLQHKIQRGPLPLDEVVDYIDQVCRGLSQAHGRGIVHRDIKPANVFVTNDGIVKVLDFGIAKLADQATTGTGQVLGTAAYMSPEQADGNPVDHRSDVWSVGVLMYELLTGRVPFVGANLTALLNSLLHDAPIPLSTDRPDVPPGFQAVVEQALAKKPADRYPTVAALARAIDAVDVEQTAAAQPPVTRLLPEGERRSVTVLVTHIAGYDALVEQLPAHEVDDTVERIQSAISQCVSEHGGVVNQRSPETVVSLFGVPVTHEDDTIRAGRAALAMHANVRDLAAPEGTAGRISLQSGIDSGRVVVQGHVSGDQQYRIVGQAVGLSARLAGEADLGSVLVSKESHRQLHAFFETECCDPIRLKSGASTTPYRLIRDAGHEDRFASLPPHRFTDYQGRETELTILRSRWQQAREGHGQVVSIIGEAGLGKSRLLREFSRGLATHDTMVLRGRCRSSGNTTAYLPFLDVVRDLLDLRADQPTTTHVEDAFRRLSAWIPGFEQSYPVVLQLLSIVSDTYPLPSHLQGENLRVAIREVLTALLTMRATVQPIVVLLEDWHWVDDASSDVLNHLIPLTASHPIFVAVAYRPEAHLDTNEPHHTTIHLPPLDRPATAAMTGAVLGVSNVPDPLVGLIYQRTGGNPFFIEEIVQALVEGESIVIDGPRVVVVGDTGAAAIPDTVQGVIRSRLDRMDSHSREVMCHASVIGRDFERELLGTLRPDDDRLDHALDQLRKMGVIQQTKVLPQVEYRFKHALTQEVTYESLLQHQRRDLHGRVGAAMERARGERGDDGDHRLARHFAHAEMWDKAVHYGLLSAERAWELGEFTESMRTVEAVERWFDRAPGGSVSQDTHVRVLFHKERLCEVLGLRRQQLEIVERLIAILDVADNRIQVAEAYLRLGDLQISRQEFTAAEHALTRSQAIAVDVGHGAHERKTLRSLGLLRWYQGRNDEAVSIIEQVLAADRKRGDQEAVIVDITNLTTVLRELGEFDRCRDILRDELRIVEQSESTSRKPYLLHIFALVERSLGNLDTACRYIEESTTIAESEGMVLSVGFHMLTLANIHWTRGDTDQALAAWGVAVERLRATRHAEGLTQVLRALGDALVGLQRPDEARPYFEEAVAMYERLEDYAGAVGMWYRIGRVHGEAGAYPQAMAAWGKGRTLCRERALAELELDIVEDMARLTRSHVPEPSLALQYYQEAAALAQRVGRLDREGQIRNTIAIIEWDQDRYEAALAEYGRALQCCRDAGEEAQVGLILNSIGVTLYKLGRHDEATSQLAAAIEHNRRIGELRLEALALAALGDVHRARERTADAINVYSASLELRREIGDTRGEGWMLHHLACAYGQEGALDRKRDCASAAWRVAEAGGDDELIDVLRHL